MAVLVIADISNEKLATDALSRTINAVSALGDVHVLVAGYNVDAASAEAATLNSAVKIICADDGILDHSPVEPISELIIGLSSNYTHIVSASNATSRSVLPRVAALLDTMIIPDVIAVIDGETFERPIYAGNAVQRVRSSDKIKILTIRTANFEPCGTGNNAIIETITPKIEPSSAKWIEDKVQVSEHPELTSARIVVSGGRGIGSKENFHIVEDLAGKLGAAVGASRAAVDSGYAPNDWQVGQTGKVVAPELYIAVGISGAIQHLAGMKDSKIIVAINKDPDAPIFQIADYGLQADLFEAVPELTGKVA